MNCTRESGRGHPRFPRARKWVAPFGSVDATRRAGYSTRHPAGGQQATKSYASQCISFYFLSEIVTEKQARPRKTRESALAVAEVGSCERMFLPYLSCRCIQ